ncbi:MAG: bifunctional folylpolyglutamate synthase/dihydrofolate synthase [Campylobacterota bacterium]|nr:bifunctional folylpolyglutamate synthase/dihydrofolate synthase [Campylobacterota bacterium]
MVHIPSFSSFLEAKPLYYKVIDHQRVHQTYTTLKEQINHPRTIHIVGTNGKGSTGRMIAHLAYRSGLKTGHFSSPHILKFNERIWINGRDSSDQVLESAHQRLYRILGSAHSEALSYFEYTTLLALVVFEKLDLIVLEAGLGGEYDATNVCNKELSVITPIGIDHQAFLGETIEEIASTKIRSMQKLALLAPQVYPEVFEVAQKIVEEKGAELILSVERLALSVEKSNDTSSSYSAIPEVEYTQKKRELSMIAKEKGWPGYLIDNAIVAVQALDLLDIRYDISDLNPLELFGRFYLLTHNIRIDVGHNPLAAKVIVKALDDEVVLIYNSLDDKDYETVFRILKPKVKRVEIIPIVSQRAVTMEGIERALQSIGLPYCDFDGTIDDEDNYLVFGSFYVVEAFIKQIRLDEKES